MSRFRSVFAAYVTIGLMLCGFAAAASAQQARNEREIRNIVQNLNSKVDDFRYSLAYGLRNTGGIRDNDADTIENHVSTMKGKIKNFEDSLDQRRENADDVTDILNAAKGVNDFLISNKINNTVQKDWTGVRALLDQLASNYSVSWNWTGDNYNRNDSRTSNYPTQNYPTDNRTSDGLTGTYSLDAAKSEDTREIIRNSGATTDAERQDLENKLEAAEQIAIEVRGTQVTLASSKAAPVSLAADGRVKTENVNGRTIRVRAALRGQELTLSSVGGETDYTITFTSLDNGKTLKVTRRITTDYMSQTVFAESFYNKTDAVARFDGSQNPNSPTDTNQTDDNNGSYSSNDPNDVPNGNSPNTTQGRTGTFIVPGGTVITAMLENYITTKVSQNNDRFKLTVQAPNEYRGATIEGYVTGVNRSGKVSGRSQVTFNFERITLRSGETYEFAGFLQGVTDANGKQVKIDTEGTAKGDSQTKETVKRGGIGAGLGAIIGAIAGGGKGAAIGAIIGGGAGAGSVVLQGKDDLELQKGSIVTITASSPSR